MGVTRRRITPLTNKEISVTQTVSIVLTDDLDGSDADETVTFSLDGAWYELDLSSRNAAAMREAVRPYVSAARRVNRPSSRRSARTEKRPFDEVDPMAVRAWAASNQVQVSPRGRIPASVLEGFRAAGH